MSRFLRKLASGIRVQELVTVVVVLMGSVLLGISTQWCYKEFGRQAAFVAAVNGL